MCAYSECINLLGCYFPRLFYRKLWTDFYSLYFLLKPMSAPVACKVVLLGEAGCGKSCILARYLHDRFNDSDLSTVGAAFGTKAVHTSKGLIPLHIWDTAGDEKYRALTNLYYRNANAAIVCCDLTSRKSFDTLEYWIGQVKDAEKDCKLYVCGNKIDLIWDEILPREVTVTDLQSFDSPVLETSSKSDYNISSLFEMIAHDFALGIRPKNVVKSIRLHSKSDELPETERRKCCFLN